MKIFIICTVRNATSAYKQKLENYVSKLEAEGHTVHLPHRDTDQTQPGICICSNNRKAIESADRVDIFYNPDSQGTHFDMGMAFMANKPIKVVENVPFGEGKSYPRMLTEWDQK
jgi:nucleoside 2-deoxyribosyltransferase